MEKDAPRVVEEEPEDGAPSGGIEIVELEPLPPEPPLLVRIENWQLPEKLQIKPGRSVTWELDVDPGVIVGIAFRSSPLGDRNRLGPFASLELGGAALENGRHRVQITGFSAEGHEDFERTYEYALTVLAQETGVSLQTEEPSTDVSGQLMVDKSGKPPGAHDPKWPWAWKPGRDKEGSWQRVFLKVAPAPEAVSEPEPAPGD